MDFIPIPGEGLGHLVAHIVTNYLAQYYVICAFWHLDNFDYLINSFMKNSPIIHNQNQTVNQYAEYPIFYLYKFKELDDHDTIVLNAVDSGCQAFIIATDTSVNFMNAYSAVRHSFFQRYPSNHMVFVPSMNTKPHDTNIILDHPIAIDIPDLIIITPQYNNTDKYDLISTKFVGRYNNTAPILLNTYDCSTKTFVNGNKNLFPNKLLNLEGRELKLSLVLYVPYTVYYLTEPGLGNANYLDSNEEKNIHIEGSEAMPFVEFCKRFNCTLVVWPANDNDWGGTYSNGSGYGLLGEVAMRKIDVGISGLYHWYGPYKDLDLSKLILRTSLNLLTPKPLLLPQWQLPALPFSRYLWYAVLVSFVITIMSLVVIDYFVDLSTIVLVPENRINLSTIVVEVSAVLLGQAARRRVTRIPEMVIMGCMLLISMIIDSAYTGGLASFMAIPRYEEPIETIHQLATRGWEWGANGEAWTFAFRLSKDPDIVRLLQLYRSFTPEQMTKRITTRDYSFIIEKSHSGYYSIPEYIDINAMNNLRLMRDHIYADFTAAFAYKTWPLLTTLNPLLLNIFQADMARNWELHVALKYMDNRLQIRVANSRLLQESQQGPTALNMDQLLGAFGLLLFGHSIAFLFFLGEFLVERQLKKRKIAHVKH